MGCRQEGKPFPAYGTARQEEMLKAENRSEPRLTDNQAPQVEGHPLQFSKEFPLKSSHYNLWGGTRAAGPAPKQVLLTSR